MRFAQRIKTAAQKRMNFWLARRMPANQRYVLNGKSIFIFPSRFGFAYLFVLLLLFLLGTNYQNNLILLLCFMLASVFITTMLHSYFNLSGLEVSLKKSAEGFCDEQAKVLIGGKAARERLSFSACFEQDNASSIHIQSLHDETVSVPIKMLQRGEHKAPRVKLLSQYPFGLFNAWTKVDLSISLLAYPKKLSPPKSWLKQFHVSQSYLDSGDCTAIVVGTEDFYQLNQYQQGQPLSQVAWKQAAKGKGLLSKSYVNQVSSERYLSLSEMPTGNIEVKLSYLAFMVSHLSNDGVVFGLDLSGEKILPNHGAKHHRACLTALAKYGQVGVKSQT